MKKLLLLLALVMTANAFAAEPLVLNVWTGKPPGETKSLPPEADQTKDTDKLIAGRRIIKLGNVSTPQITVYRPAPDRDTGTSIIVAPGGGHNILAYDLEGTEVAEWLNSIGVTGIVLKYRVPARHPDKRWLAAVQDAQRAVSLVRSKGVEWKLNPDRIGILGFSAGGETAGLTALLFNERQYIKEQDPLNSISCRPDFALLIYPGGFVDQKTGTLREYVKVPENCPPFFFAQTWDDHVTVLNSLLLGAELKKAKVPVAMHLYPTGGHGYGLRRTTEPVTTWPDRAAEWLRHNGWLTR